MPRKEQLLAFPGRHTGTDLHGATSTWPGTMRNKVSGEDQREEPCGRIVTPTLENKPKKSHNKNEPTNTNTSNVLVVQSHLHFRPSSSFIKISIEFPMKPTSLDQFISFPVAVFLARYQFLAACYRLWTSSAAGENLKRPHDEAPQDKFFLIHQIDGKPW